MIRLLVCFAYFFRGQRILPWVCGFGAVLLTLELLLPGDTNGALTSLGAVFLGCFPILVGGLSYRQLIANRRMALVPGLRNFASVALLLLALFGAVLAGYVAADVESGPDPWRIGQLAFAIISLYLLVSQWMITHRAATIGLIILPLIALRFITSPDGGYWESILVPWAWDAIAGLGWLWLAVAVGRKVMPRRLASANAGNRAEDTQTIGFQPASGGTSEGPRYASAAGTLMRGRSDSWSSRVIGALMIVLLFPVMMTAVVYVIGVPLRDPDSRQLGEFLLGVSFLGSCSFPALMFAEWPARLRLLWLRAAGDRVALWRRLERTLLQEVALVTVVASAFASGLLAWSEVPRDLVFLYLPGVVLAVFAGCYLGFLARVSGWHAALQGVPVFIFVFGFVIGGKWLRNSVDPLAVFWLLPFLAVLAVTLRQRARSRFLRVDWCRVRPTRLPRQLA